VRIGHGTLDRILNEGSDGRLGVMLALEPCDALAHRARRITLKGAREQRSLVAERIVKAGALDTHVLGQISDRRRPQAAAPEAGDGGIESLVLIE
jgi:hypothetical protein